MKSKISLLFLMLFIVSTKIYGQDSETIIYSIFRFDKKIGDLCSTQENYQTRMMPKTLDSDLRRTIIKKQESIFEKNDKIMVDVKNLYLRKGDWVAIIKVKYDLKNNCNGVKTHKILAVSAKNQEELKNKINSEIFVMYGMMERYYVSHEVVQEFQPFKEDDSSFIETISDWIYESIHEELTEDQKKKLRLNSKRNDSGGVRN